MSKIIKIIAVFSKSLLPGLLLLISANAWPQEPMVMPRLSGPINFDGVPNEEVWQSIPVLPMVMYTPVFGNEPTELSVIKIAYDNDYLYVSGIFNYKNPDDIRAFSKKRDYSTGKCDWLGVLIDTFNDRQNSVMFWTNPNGLRTEGTLQNDMADANADMSFSWNTFWDAKSEINDNGWSAEIRIPFSSLRFQAQENKTLMGITIANYRAAKAEWISFPAIPPEVANAIWKPSNTSMIEFTGLKPEKPLYVTPYVTGGIGQVNELNDAGTEYDHDYQI